MNVEEKVKRASNVKPDWLANGLTGDEADEAVRKEEQRKWFATFRMARKEHGLTQASVAKKLGVNTRTYGRRERGESVDLLPLSKVIQAAEIVGIQIGWIYCDGYYTTNTVYCADGIYRKETSLSYVDAVFNGEVD